MQLFALDKDKKIFIGDAIRGVNYSCFECGKYLRMRGGQFRRKHFYHSQLDAGCRHSKKSEKHLRVQLQIQKLLPVNDSELEFIFIKILRIADVVWFSRNIVFEVQCSNIAEHLVKERTEDYHSIGYEVVWILDDWRFNKWKVTPSEYFIKSLPHYYVSVSKENITFYDQFDLIQKFRRKHRGPPQYVELGHVFFTYLIEKKSRKKAPKILKNRMETHRVYFSRDLTEIYLREKDSTLYRSTYLKGIKRPHRLKQLYIELLEIALTDVES